MFLFFYHEDTNNLFYLKEFKQDTKQFTFTKYSCREMAYTRGMHNLVSLIDIFHNKTDERIVRYLGKKFVDRARIQQQSYENSSSSSQYHSFQSKQSKHGLTLYEKRMQAYNSGLSSQQLGDNSNGGLELSQVLDETDTANRRNAANMTYSDMMSLLNEIDKIKPQSSLNIDEDEEITASRLKQMSANNNYRYIASSKTIASSVEPKNLAELVMEKVKHVERVQASVRRDPAVSLKKLNNKKSLSYGEYTVDLVVKDPPASTHRSDENSTNSTGSDLSGKIRPLKSSSNQKPAPSQQQLHRQRIQSSKSTKSTKSNYDINLEKECEIVDVYTPLKSRCSNRNEELVHGISKPATSSGRLAASIPHQIPLNVATFSLNEKYYTKKSGTPGTTTESSDVTVMRPIIKSAKSGVAGVHLAKFNNFIYLNTLANTNRTSTKHLVEELNRREKEPPMFPMWNADAPRPSTNKTVRIVSGVSSSYSNLPNSSRDFKSRNSYADEIDAAQTQLYDRLSVPVSRRSAKMQSQQQQQQQSPLLVSNQHLVRNSESQIMTKYLESLKRGGLYTENSKPIVRNILAEVSNKKLNKSQRS
jgi:hypothetical protein